jgi:hypothetical protein
MRCAHRLAVAVVAILSLAGCGGRPTTVVEHDDMSFLQPEQLEARIAENLEGRTFDLDMKPLSLRLPASEDPYTAIAGEEIHGYLRELTEFSLQSKHAGDVLWGRVQGTVYERRATEYIQEKFEEWGLQNVRMEDFRCHQPQWNPTEIGLTLIGGSSPGAPAEDYTFATAMTGFQAAVTPERGITAPVEYIGLGSPADLFGRDLTGKIAFVHSKVYEGVHIHSARQVVSRLVEEGKALGVIVWLDLPQNARYACRCGDDAHKIPWVTIGNYDGIYLRKVIEHSGPDNPPMVTLTVRGTMDEHRASQNLLAELPGTTDEWVILTAHTDGYWSATLDNGSGLAAMMTLARYHAQQPRSSRKRNMLFLAAGDHEVPGAGGTVHFANNHEDILAKTAVVYQFEHLSSIAESEELAGFSLLNTENPRGIMVTNMSPVLLDLFMEAADRYGIVSAVGTYPNYWGDVVGFMDTGVTAVGWIEANYFYHSELDGPDVITPQGLERITRAYAWIMDKVEGYSRVDLEEGAIETPSLHYESDMQKLVHSMW